MTVLKYTVWNDDSLRCQCSVKHIPKPVSFAKLDDGVLLCPSGLFNLQKLLSEWDLNGGCPSGSVTKHYGKVIRDLAEQIYLAR